MALGKGLGSLIPQKKENVVKKFENQRDVQVYTKRVLFEYPLLMKSVLGKRKRIQDYLGYTMLEGQLPKKLTDEIIDYTSKKSIETNNIKLKMNKFKKIKKDFYDGTKNLELVKIVKKFEEHPDYIKQDDIN